MLMKTFGFVMLVLLWFFLVCAHTFSLGILLLTPGHKYAQIVLLTMFCLLNAHAVVVLSVLMILTLAITASITMCLKL